MSRIHTLESVLAEFSRAPTAAEVWARVEYSDPRNMYSTTRAKVVDTNAMAAEIAALRNEHEEPEPYVARSESGRAFRASADGTTVECCIAGDLGARWHHFVPWSDARAIAEVVGEAREDR